MEQVEKVIEYLKRSHSPFHVVALLSERLKEEGYEELREEKEWSLKEGGRYFVTRNGSSLIAFRLPVGASKGFHLSCVHTDSPTFKVKPNPVIQTGDGYVLNVEPYGGMIDSTWMDRPLTLSGRVIVMKEGKIRSLLFSPDKDLLFIPNLCIHMNRTVNEGMKFNAAKDMLPLIGMENIDFKAFLAESLSVKKEEVFSFDLFLTNRDKPRKVGINEEFLSSPKLDDLASCHAAFMAFLEADATKVAPVFAAFDNEEVGSLTRQGANSTFLKDSLTRLCRQMGWEYEQSIASSLSLSIDNAHANHPNHPEISDSTTKVLLGKGVVIKHSARQSYTTDALSCAIVKAIAKNHDIPVQEYTDRSDLRGGSTLGNISNSEVSLLSCDIGIAQFAMHSSNELCAIKDIGYMISFVKAFYETGTRMDGQSIILE